MGASSANAQLKAQWQQQVEQYKQQQYSRRDNYIQEINRYRTGNLQYEMADRRNTEELYQGFSDVDQWYGDLSKTLKVQDQNVLMDLLQKKGLIAATDNAVGASSARRSRIAGAQAGMQRAMLQESLRSAYNTGTSKNQQLLGIYRRNRMDEWLPRTIAPDPGFEPAKPTFAKAQSPFKAFALGAVSGAVGGAMKADWSNNNNNNNNGGGGGSSSSGGLWNSSRGLGSSQYQPGIPSIYTPQPLR